MKNILATLLTVCAVVSCAQTQPKSQVPVLDYEQLNAQALKEYDQPVRPGYEGKNPYWNGYSTRFIYAPAFDLPEVEGAASYRYTASVKEQDFSFTAEKPNLALTPIWRKMPVGACKFRVPSSCA